MAERIADFITEADYLARERTAETRSEYLAGEVFAMAGASRRHNLIVANLIFSLVSRLKAGPWRVYPSDMRLKVTASGLYTYPDVMVVCEPEMFIDDREDTLVNPDVIVEVPSDATEACDRGLKFAHYRRLPALMEYLMVSQNVRKIERYARAEAGEWVLTETDEDHDTLFLAAIGCTLEVSEVYDKTGV